jgi:hypothetical protein
LLIVTLRMERGCLTLTTSTVLEACWVYAHSTPNSTHPLLGAEDT